MQQIIIKEIAKIGDIILVDQKQTHHLLRVLRIKNASLLLIADASSKMYDGICKIEDGKLFVEIIKERKADIKRIDVHLVAALIKRDKWEWMLQKCCELGASSITPLITKRVVIKADEKQLNNKYERWNKIIEEACKQCNRNDVPIINPAQIIDNLQAKADINLCAYEHEEERNSLGKIYRQYPNINSACIVIGCEGGFASEEISILKQKGFQTVSLGKRILRAETAACSVVANTMFYYEQLGEDDEKTLL